MSFRHVMLEWSNIITKFSANKQNLISLSIFMYVAMATAHTSAKLSKKKLNSGLLTRVLSFWRPKDEGFPKKT